jgi:hypothetical protein
MLLLCLSALLIGAEPSNAKDQGINEKVLLGAWYFKSGDGAFEILSIEIEDGQHNFYSWLHDRPDSKGTWTLVGSTITFNTDSGDVVVWEILKITTSELTILESGETQTATYVRQPTNGFGNAGDD